MSKQEIAIPVTKAMMTAWIKRINEAWQKGIDAVLETGRLLLQAKAELPHGNFEAMVRSHLNFSAGMARMLMNIANHPVLSNRQHANDLPTAWTTLYELSHIAPPDLTKAITDGTITPRTERSEVKEMLESGMIKRKERKIAKSTGEPKRRGRPPKVRAPEAEKPQEPQAPQAPQAAPQEPKEGNRARILDVLKKGPATSDDVRRALPDIDPLKVRRDVSALVTEGWAVPNGERRPGESGNDFVVYHFEPNPAPKSKKEKPGQPGGPTIESLCEYVAANWKDSSRDERIKVIDRLISTLGLNIRDWMSGFSLGTNRRK